MDLVVVLPLTYFMSWSVSNTALTQVLPPQSLLAWSIIISLIGQVIIQVLFQAASLFFVLKYTGASFYIPFVVDPANETSFLGYENTVIFLVAGIQTVVAALVLSLGTRPWKIGKALCGYTFWYIIHK